MKRSVFLAVGLLLPSLLAAQSAPVPSRLSLLQESARPVTPTSAAASLAAAAPATQPASPGASAPTSEPAGEPASQAALPDKQVQYYVLLLNARKVGYLIHKRQAEQDKVTTTEMLELTAIRGNDSATVLDKETSVETLDGQPLNFASFLKLSNFTRQVEGTIHDGKMRLLINDGVTQSRQELPWPKDALMPEGLRLLQLSKGLAEGTTYTVRAFVPTSLSASDQQVTIGKKGRVDLLGQTVEAYEVKSVSDDIVGGLNATSFINEQMDVLRSSMPVFGRTVEIIAASRSIALAKPEVFDNFDTMAVDSPGPLAITKQTPSATYVLAGPKDQKLSLVESDYQSVKFNEATGLYTVTVKKAAAEGDYYLPYQDDDAAARKALAPSRFVQSEDETVKQLAQQAVGDAKLASEAAAKLEAFVSEYVNKKDLSVGYASAAEVARTREGDCTEHAVLLAALCRSAGIPARVACGVAYVPAIGQKKDVFMPHAWVEAYVGKEWICLDAALRGFDVGHIALAHGDGDPESFFGIVNTLGNFKIASASVEKPAASEPAP